MMLIQVSSLAAFSVGKDETGDRLAHAVTIFLASVAYQVFVGSLLPKLSYMTFTDAYIAFCNFYVVAIIALLSVIGFAKKLELWESYSEQDDYMTF
jgi:hypothetical protein